MRLGAFVIEAKVSRNALVFTLLCFYLFFTLHYMVHLAILHTVRTYL